MKSNVHKLDVDKLSDVVQNDVWNAKINNMENEITDITNLATNTTLNPKINDVINQMPSVTNVATTTATISKRMSSKTKYLTLLA